MQIKNLTPKQTEMLESTLSLMQAANPHLDWYHFPMGDPTGPAVDPIPGLHHGYPNEVYNPTIGQIEELKEAVAALDRKIDLIFGGHVLMNGQFVKVT